MIAHYDKEVDVLLIKLSNHKPEYGEDIGNGIIVHFDRNKAPAEIEILGAKKYLVDWIGQALEVRKKPQIVESSL
ncbi:MAG TPA: DUF2283 domain-containing protein [Candidatus Nanoarchaeia archaeon]|nr:DUF2283 domain-containing protein [Candidatus Nanoarchaeia archaeon]